MYCTNCKARLDNRLGVTKMLHTLLAPVATIILVLGSQHCAAAHIEYQWFDVPSCTRGSVTTDLTDLNAYLPESTVRKQAAEWIVFESSNNCFGFCTYTENELFTCRRDSCAAFPLAGATYKPIRDKGTLESLLCVEGCSPTVPRLIHNMGYEAEESDRNIEYDRTVKRFKSKCVEPRKPRK
jgi:hypothetical protein